MVAWARGWPVVKIWMRGFVDRLNVVMVVEVGVGRREDESCIRKCQKCQF